MKKSFTSKYTDKHYGTKVETKITVHKVDLTSDLGNKFVFIESVTIEPDRSPIVEEISIPVSSLKKLIKTLETLLEE